MAAARLRGMFCGGTCKGSHIACVRLLCVSSWFPWMQVTVVLFPLPPIPSLTPVDLPSPHKSTFLSAPVGAASVIDRYASVLLIAAKTPTEDAPSDRSTP